MAQAGWYPDPTGRNAQRYFDGTTWTDQVVTTGGNQTRDPISGPPPTQQQATVSPTEPTQTFTAPPTAPAPTPPTDWGGPGDFGAPWGPAPSASTAAGARRLSVPALLVAAVGLVLVILSLFALDFLEAGGEGGNFSDVRDAIEDLEDEDFETGVGAINEMYVKFGYIITLIAAGALGLLAALRKALWPAAVLAGLIGAVWHIVTVFDLTGDGVDAAIGAWLGVVGYLALAAAGLVAFITAKPAVSAPPGGPGGPSGPLVGEPSPYAPAGYGIHPPPSPGAPPVPEPGPPSPPPPNY